jgi:hypothetical protein
MGALEDHRPERRCGLKDERFEGALVAVDRILDAGQTIPRGPAPDGAMNAKVAATAGP